MGNATFVNAKRAYFSPTQIVDSNVSGAVDLGRRAAGTALGNINVGTSDVLTSKRPVSADRDIVWVGYGSVVDPTLADAQGSAEIVSGYLYLANASGTRLEEIAVDVVSAYRMETDDDAQRARCLYSFYSYGDTPDDTHVIYDAAVVTEVA